MPGGGHLTFATAPSFRRGGLPERRHRSRGAVRLHLAWPTREAASRRRSATRSSPLLHDQGAGQGHGAGLSMVYSSVRSHGGFVRLVSSVGVGTTVQILLPVLEASGDADEPRAPKTEIPRGVETRARRRRRGDSPEPPVRHAPFAGVHDPPRGLRRGGDRDPSYAPEKVDLVIVDRIMPGWTASRPRADPRPPSVPPDDPLLRTSEAEKNALRRPFRTGFDRFPAEAVRAGDAGPHGAIRSRWGDRQSIGRFDGSIDATPRFPSVFEIINA